MSDSRLKLVGTAQGFDWLPVCVANELGYFRDAGVAVEVIRVGGVNNASRAVADCDAHIAITSPEAAILDHVAGGGLCIFAANSSCLPGCAPSRRPARNVTDLRRRRIKTSRFGDGSAIYTQGMLAAHGLAYSTDEEFAPAEFRTAWSQTLHKYGVAAVPFPTRTAWGDPDGDRRLGLLEDFSQPIPELPFGAFVGRRTWLWDNRELISAFLTAVDRAHRFINDAPNTNACAAIFRRIVVNGGEAATRRGFVAMRELGMWPDRLGIRASALETTIDLMIRSNLLVRSQREFARSAVDPRFLKAALG